MLKREKEKRKMIEMMVGLKKVKIELELDGIKESKVEVSDSFQATLVESFWIDRG